MTSPAACCSNKRSAKKANFELLSRSRGRKGVGKQTERQARASGESWFAAAVSGLLRL